MLCFATPNNSIAKVLFYLKFPNKMFSDTLAFVFP